MTDRSEDGHGLGTDRALQSVAGVSGYGRPADATKEAGQVLRNVAWP